MAIQTTVDGIKRVVGVGSPTTDDLAMIEFCATYAESVIKNRRGQTIDEDLEPIYQPLAITMGVYLYLKRDMFGVIGASENGVSVNYETGDIPLSMINQITPKVKVI